MLKIFKAILRFSFILFYTYFAYPQNSLIQEYKRSHEESLVFPDSTIRLFIDPNSPSLSEKDKSFIVLALNRLSKNANAFDTVKIKPNDNVSSIVKEQYNFYESDNFILCSAIMEDIKTINNLNSNFFLLQGDSLILPTLPKEPSKTNSKALVQVIDLQKKEIKISTLNNLLNLNDTVNENQDLAQIAGLWMYNISKKQKEIFFNSLPIDVKRRLYGEAFITLEEEPRFLELHFDSSSIAKLDNRNEIFKKNSTNNIDTTLKSKLADIRSKDFGTYYVLDFFDENGCAHGFNVISVIKQRLKEYCLDTLKINIIPVQIDYINNQEKSIEFLESIINDEIPFTTQIELKSTIKSLNELKKKNIIKCKTCVPEIFLDITLKHFYKIKPEPDIISTSFWSFSFRSIKPNFFKSSRTNLITAATNDHVKIEDLIENQNGAIEPLASCYTTYDKFGSIIVGCQLAPGQFHGMYSSSGKGVSILGKGMGWDTIYNCFGPASIGTSYATPDIGIKLLIAKAFWRSKNLKPFPNAIESRFRLLLSIDLDTSLIGKFGSPGQPNLIKLLRTSNGYIQKLNGSIEDCIIKDSYIEYNTFSKKPFKRGDDGIAGIFFLGNKTYVFFESSQSWQEIDINKLFVKVIYNGNEEIYTSVTSLKEKFIQLTTLKN